MNAMTNSVEVASDVGLYMPCSRDFMKCELVTLVPGIDVFDAIDHILKRRISGAPVVDQEGRFEGVFSEKTAMRVLVAAIHDQLPGTNVGSYMNLDRNRIIHEEDSLLEVAHKFQETPYRRLPVLHGTKLVGQVSRRDVLRAEHRLAIESFERASMPEADQRLVDLSNHKIVSDYMDYNALTASPNCDMLTIAQMFLNSPYRRLPILDNGKLVGQVSRRDLLEAAASLLRPEPRRHTAHPLYLSPLTSSAPPSIG